MEHELGEQLSATEMHLGGCQTAENPGSYKPCPRTVWLLEVSAEYLGRGARGCLPTSTPAQRLGFQI